MSAAGADSTNTPFRLWSVQINPNSKAYNQGLQVGDRVHGVNGKSTGGLLHKEALQLIRNANSRLTLELHRLVLLYLPLIVLADKR